MAMAEVAEEETPHDGGERGARGRGGGDGCPCRSGVRVLAVAGGAAIQPDAPGGAPVGGGSARCGAHASDHAATPMVEAYSDIVDVNQEVLASVQRPRMVRCEL